MARFKGQASYSVDSKGRVAIPAKMRSAMNPEAKNTFTITRGFEQCIFLYPLDKWEAIEDEFEQLNLYQRESRDFVRIILMWAEEVTLDGQGRVRIPETLMDYARITDKALIIGALDHIEIWNPELFDAYINSKAERYETLAEQVMGV
ncbi:division/cell wall cluster transcriptional repressor MraZ [Rhodocaloribacter litoris]|uniref:division/cell wall cluster transcriptional repressor MraZ n=1 Tax=Rhodocaloribacter litoris TaxID=2558931 RepID=UPI00142333FA|nr:division/cell wall cluster transcriptional repressor MraZ [Rhodocaloribacter litoris]QXD17086.1 division/cell wall cluster transcriptional repressor MraZ [Rhodocaloribacter litoris]GIV60104.1 MAG: transcriptional regulator MraZ [Rhodothermaceae bacterium]